jgi:hypothetical protein
MAAKGSAKKAGAKRLPTLPLNQRMVTAAHMEALTGNPVNWSSGHGAFCTDAGKIYCFINREGKLALKLPTERIEELIDAGQARFLTMGVRTLREWAVVEVPESKKDLKVLLEARRFVESLPVETKRKKR